MVYLSVCLSPAAHMSTFGDLWHGLMCSPCLGLATLGTPCPLSATARDPAAIFNNRIQYCLRI